MTRHGKRSEGAEVSTVSEGQETKGDDDEEDSFLVDVPAEEERAVAAKRKSGGEGVPIWVEEEFYEGRLGNVNECASNYMGSRLTSCAARVRMKVMRGVISGNTANTVSPTRPRVTLLTASVLTGSFKNGATARC